MKPDPETAPEPQRAYHKTFLKRTRTKPLPLSTQSTTSFAPGGASSAGRMKLKSGIRVCETKHVVEGGRIISTNELMKSVNAAADRFLRRVTKPI